MTIANTVEVKLPFTIRGNGAFLISMIIFWALFWLLIAVLYLSGERTDRILVIGIVVIPIFLIWARYVRIVLSFDGITFYSGFIREFSLNWVDIQSVTMGLELYGTQGEKLLVFHSNNPSKKNIKLNYLYFRRIDIFLVLQMLFSKNPQVQVNKETLEYFQRSGKAFAKKHAA
jgi:hypothetical protein